MYDVRKKNAEATRSNNTNELQQSATTSAVRVFFELERKRDENKTKKTNNNRC
jgi:hypothetical protein